MYTKAEREGLIWLRAPRYAAMINERAVIHEAMPTFAEIEPLSLSDRVINALKDAFFAGELKPGDAIVERDLARQMKVGTPVVREALISLQGQGFVRRVTNTGTFVTQFTVDEVRQLYTLRVELEVLALQWARPRVTENDLKEFSRQIAKVVEAGERGDRRQFLELDYAFHKQCWALSGMLTLPRPWTA